ITSEFFLPRSARIRCTVGAQLVSRPSGPSRILPFSVPKNLFHRTAFPPSGDIETTYEELRMTRGAISVREAGRRGGLARIRKASLTQLSQSGRHAANARWSRLRERRRKPARTT